MSPEHQLTKKFFRQMLAHVFSDDTYLYAVCSGEQYKAFYFFDSTTIWNSRYIKIKKAHTYK